MGKINKTMYVTITAFLLLTMSTSLFFLPTISAHTPPWTISTYAFIEASPNPVGVGQTAYVNFWIDKVPPTAIGIWGTGWHNFALNVTKPDGTTEDLGKFNSDATGGALDTNLSPTLSVITRFTSAFQDKLQ